MSCRLHGYPWPSLATSPYRSSPLAGLQGYISYPHIAAVCMFELVVLHLLGHMWGSKGVHHLWASKKNISFQIDRWKDIIIYVKHCKLFRPWVHGGVIIRIRVCVMVSLWVYIRIDLNQLIGPLGRVFVNDRETGVLIQVESYQRLKK